MCLHLLDKVMLPVQDHVAAFVLEHRQLLFTSVSQSSHSWASSPKLMLPDLNALNQSDSHGLDCSRDSVGLVKDDNTSWMCEESQWICTGPGEDSLVIVSGHVHPLSISRKSVKGGPLEHRQVLCLIHNDDINVKRLRCLLKKIGEVSKPLTVFPRLILSNKTPDLEHVKIVIEFIAPTFSKRLHSMTSNVVNLQQSVTHLSTIRNLRHGV